MITGNQSSNVSGTKYIDSRCIVEFRPTKDWKGEYGFDWFRRGDTEEIINGVVTKTEYCKTTKTGYRAIVGKYAPKDPDYGDNAGVLQIDKPGANPEQLYYVDKLAREEYSIFKIKGIARNYIAPYISLYYMSTRQWGNGQHRFLPKEMLYQTSDGIYHEYDFCKKEVTVKVLIDAKNIKKIVFKCDKSLTVEPNVMTGIPNGESVRYINIRHNYAFSDGHQSIKVFAHHNDGVTETFAGQINVVRCEPKTVNVCFVDVRIQINKSISSGIPKADFKTQQENNLKKFLSQAHIIPNITYKSLYLDKEKLGGHLSKRSWTDYEKNIRYNNANVILKYTYGSNSKINGFIGYSLENWFDKKYPNMANTYKVFFLGEHGWRGTPTNDAWLGGHANDIPSKTLVIYKDPKDHFVSHEIMHCFGLYHSFSNDGKHTFEKLKTSNIMDYTSDATSLWRWQWNVIRNAADINRI